MSEHKAKVVWNRDGKDFTYKTYSRDHKWIANGNEIPASATAQYLGNPNRVDPEAAQGWWHGFRIPGTNIPGVLTAGTFYGSDGFVFYDVHDTDNTIVLELDHEHYKKLVVEVADPQASVAMLENALAKKV